MARQKSIQQTSVANATGPKVGDEELIRRKAYEIYRQRVKQGSPGSPEDDWRKAERLMRRSNATE